jgi:hypothetical protein
VARLGGVGVLALAACSQMVQPAAPTQLAKAYVGLFKDNAVAVVDTQIKDLFVGCYNYRRILNS